jgi:hypothetical protein
MNLFDMGNQNGITVLDYPVENKVIGKKNGILLTLQVRDQEKQY